MSKDKSMQHKWLLPPSIEDILPPYAEQFYDLHQRLISTIRSRGYQLVYPPLVEYTDSLNINDSDNLEADLARFTNGGERLGLRADFTPQVARIDARLMDKSECNRLCYLGETFRLNAGVAGNGRSSFQVGAELFGDKSIDSDIEIIKLALDCLSSADISIKPKLILFLSHATFAKSLLEILGLSQQQEYLDLLAKKSSDYIEEFLKRINSKSKKKLSTNACTILQALPRLYGDQSTIAKAQKLIKPLNNKELTQKLSKFDKVAKSFKGAAEIYVDLGEMPGNGYSYHNGFVFGIYFAGQPQCLTEGGRYDAIGSRYNTTDQRGGDVRGATGFSIDVKRLFEYINNSE